MLITTWEKIGEFLLQPYGDGENSGTPGTEPQLSVNENQFTNVKLYPNPVVGDYINIEGINSDFETKFSMFLKSSFTVI